MLPACAVKAIFLRYACEEFSDLKCYSEIYSKHILIC